MLDNKLKSDIQKLWNRFWSGGISNPLTAIEQISYLLFLKRLEDEDNQRELNARFENKTFISIFEGTTTIGGIEIDKQTCRWSVWSQYSADVILNHIRTKVFPFIQHLGEEDSLYARYMKDAVFTIPNASLLIEDVNIINEMHIKEQNRDTKGDMYEFLLSELQTSGKNGQFRTPRHIINMITEILQPQINDTICDPSCGTAGFLISAYEYILKENTSPEFIKTDEQGEQFNFKADKLTNKDWDILKNHTFTGYDIDITMARIGLMNLMMHGIDNPNIEQLNTLSSSYTQKNYFDVILANPPFKGSIDESELSEDFLIKSKKTEILFIELIYNLLTQAGRAGVVVPEGILFGNSNAHKHIRKLLLERCRLDAVIKMPSGVFKPYAGVSTGILIFTKGEPTKEVLFYEMKSDGYSLDDKRTFIDGKGNIPNIIETFHNKDSLELQDRTKNSFLVPVEEIVSNDYNLSMSSYKEEIIEEIEYEDSEIIKNKILELEKDIIEKIKKLS
ncbi:MAG: type I restriction-modification system subunit M [Nanoarchaeota archaeon]|nr:type I restriction-modification system subunit M [Nanoarchaeota archaeon]